MAELLLSCNGLTKHGNDVDRATYGCCLVELQLTCNEFDLNSLKLVSNVEDLMETGLADGPAAAIVSAVHEHIAVEAGVEMAAALARLHQADAKLDAELLAPRLRQQRRWRWQRREGAELLAPRIVW